MKKILNFLLFLSVMASILSIALLIPTSSVLGQTQTNSNCLGYLYTVTCYTDCHARTINCPFPGTPEGYGFLCEKKNLVIYANGQKVGGSTGYACDYDGKPTCYSTCN